VRADHAAFAVFISDAVLQEINQGDPNAALLRMQAMAGIPIVPITDDAEALAQILLSKGVVPKHSFVDAMHIALATLNGADFVLTWNFKHINNIETKDKIAKVISGLGYDCPRLCSPEDLLGA